MEDAQDTQQFLDKVKSLYQSFTPALSNKVLFERLETQVPSSNNPLQATGQPIITDIKQLAEDATMDEFSKIAREIIAQDNVEEAIRFVSLFEETLLPLYPGLLNDRPEYYSNYQKFLILLKFVSIKSLSLLDIESLIKKHLITALQGKIRVQNKFQEVLDVYDDILLEGKIAETLANAMLAAEQKLSKDYLISKGTDKRLQGTLGNYLKDYQIFTFPVPGQTYRVSSVERLAYLNQNPNARGLSREDREILLKIFGIYDWLRFGQSELIIATKEPVYLKRERLIAPEPPKPKVIPKIFPKPLAQKPEERVLPPPPRPSSTSSHSPPYQGGEITPPTPLTLRGEKSVEQEASNEDLYRKTLEELRKLRAQDMRRGGPDEPPGISEAIIHASGQGHLLGGKEGEMGKGKQAEEAAKKDEQQTKSEDDNKQMSNQ